MKNKILSILTILFLLIIFISNMAFAAYSDVTMEVLSEPIATINIGNNSSLEKSLVAKDLTNKEVTIQLKVTNNEISQKPTGEIILVIDNSSSMKETASDGKTRFDLITSSAKTLISSLLQNNDQLKIGLVSFSSSANDLGTEKDATIIAPLSNDKSSLLTAIDTIPIYNESNPDGSKFIYTDLDAGLTVGNSQFSTESNNKYMIVLTDGVPNLVLGDNTVQYIPSIYSTSKAKLQKISSSGVNLISMLTGVTLDKVNPNSNPSMTYGEIAEAVFGTETNPSAGTFYNVQDSDIEKTVTQEIYGNLVGTEKVLKDITVTDYFPSEIINNFDFSYVKESNIGTISAKVDTATNSITWTIPELKVGETALVQYKLKLKENFNSAILNKVLKTNEKIDINYTNSDGTKKSGTTSDSPTLKLTEPQTTTAAPAAPTILPHAGSTVFIGLGIASILFVVFSAIKYIHLKNSLK